MHIKTWNKAKHGSIEEQLVSSDYVCVGDQSLLK